MIRIISVIFCFAMLFSLLAPHPLSAAEKECTIKIGSVEANTGDTVYIPLELYNNPGISGITATVTYNSSALQYEDYSKGSAFTSSITLKEHPTKNQIKFALVEYLEDSHFNGDILTLKFKVKNDATAKHHKIDLQYTKGDFASRTIESVMPKIISGGVKVRYNPVEKNCPHEEYGSWQIALKPTCTESGIKQRECVVCGKKDEDTVQANGHDYEEFWTIDTPADELILGIMSRHCKYCDAKTDNKVFELEDTEINSITNQLGAHIQQNNYTGTISKAESSKVNVISKIESSSKTESEITSSQASVSSSVSSSVLSEDDIEIKPDNSFKNLIITVAVILLIGLIIFIVIISCKKVV